MPKTAGLTVVLDWDDAKVKKGVSDLNNMFKTGLGNLTVDSGGVVKGTEKAADAISKLRQENKKLTTDFQNLFLADKAFTDQGQRVAESLAARAKMLKEVSAATKNVTDPKLPKIEPVLTALEDLKKRAAEAKAVLENALAGGADPNSANVLSLVDNYKQLKVQLDAISQVSSLKLPGVQPAITEIDRLKAAVKDAKQQLDSFLAGGGSIRSDAGKQLAANYNALNQQLQTLNRTVKGTQDSYARLAQVANAATRHAQNMGVTFGTTSTEFLTASKRAETLTNKLKEVDAATGRHQRNVGNYASGYNAISTNMARIVGEMPNFTQSMRLGFMAISNNIQPLAESIQDLMRKNRELAAQGQPTTSALKAIGGALFSWNTLLLVGVTALTAYGPKLIEFISGTKGAAEAAEKAKKAQEEYNNAVEQNNKRTATQVSQLQRLAAVASDTSLSTDQRRAAIKQLQDLYPSYFKNLTLETSQTALLSNQVSILTKNLLAAGKARLVAADADKAVEKFYDAEKRRLEVAKDIVKENKTLDEIKARFSKDGVFDLKKLNAAEYQVWATQAGVVKKLTQSYSVLSGEMNGAKSEADAFNNAILNITKGMGSVDIDGNDIYKSLTDGAKNNKKETKQLADAIKEVEKSLAGLETQKEMGAIGQFEYLAEKSKILQSGIKKLTEDFNVPATNSTLAQWSDQSISLNRELRKIERTFDGLSNMAAMPTGNLMDYLESIRDIDKVDSRMKKLQEAIKPPDLNKVFEKANIKDAVKSFNDNILNPLYEEIGTQKIIAEYKLSPKIFIDPKDVDSAKKQIDGLNASIKGLIKDTIISGIPGIAEGFGNMLSGMKNPFGHLVAFLGNALTQFGKYLIELGLVKLGIDKAVAALPTIGVGAGLAIVAGAAAVALGQIMKNNAQKHNQQTFKAFANGGIVSGPTHALIGEYAGAANNPEVVAPLDKLKGLIGGGSNVNVTGEFRIKGTDMLVVLERAQKYNNR